MRISRQSATDPLVHHGRHFGRTVHALCTVRTLLNNGIIRMRNLTQKPENTFSQEYYSFPGDLMHFSN